MENTIPKVMRGYALSQPEIPAQFSKDAEENFQPITYKELLEIAYNFGAGLLSLGVKRGDHIGLISENRKEWFQADMGIMGIGAADVPRGCDASAKDLSYILSFAGCENCVVENNAQVVKILSVKDQIPELKRFISFTKVEDDVIADAKSKDVDVLSFEDVLQLGKKYREKNDGAIESEFDKGTSEEIASLIFTSGTTGEPKGVMLTHGNFLAQLPDLKKRIPLVNTDIILCVLPVWHAFQRSCEYVVLSQGAALAYSKPVGSILLADIQKTNPRVIPAVPRIFEAVYDGVYRSVRKSGNVTFALFKFFSGIAIVHAKMDRKMFRKEARFRKDCLPLIWLAFIIPWLLLYPLKLLGGVLVFKKIREKFGTNLMAGVAGGGALPPAIDNFFWAVGIPVVEGYGLTETAPVVSVRHTQHPIFGTIGKPLDGLEIRIVDDNGNDIKKSGVQGTLLLRGPTIMKGYYNRPDLTAKAIDKDGWFDTGDIAMVTIDGELTLRGRKKDTIVLRGGENVEPLPLEMKINESPYIAQSVVVGQDARSLGALVVPAQDEIERFAKENGINYKDYSSLLKNEQVNQLINTEIQNLVNTKNGFRMFERIAKFVLLEKPFEVGVELSAKQEVMRYKLPQLYAKEIKSLLKDGK